MKVESRKPLEYEGRSLQVVAPGMIGEAAPLEPAAPEVDRSVEPLRAVLRRAGRDRRGPPCEGAVADLAGLHPVAGARVRAVDADGQVAGEPQVDVLVDDLGVRPGVPAALPIEAGRPVLEGGLADHLDVDLALKALDGPHEHVLGLVVGGRATVRLEVVVLAPVPEREGVVGDHPAGSGHPGGLEHVRSGLVAAADRRRQAGRSDPPEPGAAIQHRAEDAFRVEARQAEPLDRALGGDERAGVAVREEAVPGDTRVAGLERWHAPRRLFGRDDPSLPLRLNLRSRVV